MLPVYEMLGWFNLHGIRNDVASAVRGWTKSHDLRVKRNATVVLVVRDVVQGSVNGHARGLKKSKRPSIY